MGEGAVGWGWGLLMTGWQIQSEYWGVVGGSCDINYNYHDFKFSSSAVVDEEISNNTNNATCILI